MEDYYSVMQMALDMDVYGGITYLLLIWEQMFVYYQFKYSSLFNLNVNVYYDNIYVYDIYSKLLNKQLFNRSNLNLHLKRSIIRIYYFIEVKMTDRRSNINLLNSKYHASELKRSKIVVGGISSLAAPGGVTTVRRSTIGQSAIHGAVGISGVTGVHRAVNTLRTSKIVTPPIYEAVTHPPVFETVTTPGKVHQIVTPVIDIAPDTVIERATTTAAANRTQTGRLWAKRDRVGGCPWWCWLLLCLLLLGLLLGGLWYFFSRKEQFTSIETKQVEVQPIVEPAFVEPIVKEPETVQEQQPVKNPEPVPEMKEPEPQPQPTNVTKEEQVKTTETEPKQEQPALNAADDNVTSNDTKQPHTSSQQPVTPAKTPKCLNGSFLHNGKCLKCPPKSTWDGSNCIRKVVTKNRSVEYRTEGESSGDKKLGNEGTESNSEEASSSSKTTSSTEATGSKSESPNSSNISQTKTVGEEKEKHHQNL